MTLAVGDGPVDDTRSVVDRVAFARQLVVNAAGTWWPAAVQFLVVPLYVSLLGVESYGLVALYTTLLTVAKVFDLGIGYTINRELARAPSHRWAMPGAQNPATLISTLEVAYWGIGLMLTASLWFGAAIASGWIHSAALNAVDVTRIIRLMALAFAVTWPVAFYQNALLGLGLTTRANLAAVAASTLAAACSSLALVYITRDLSLFFLCQIGVGVVHLAVLRTMLYASRRKAVVRTTMFDIDVLRSLWRTTAGTGTLVVIGILLSQIDRVIVSRLLTLESFGYYMLGATIASGIAVVSAPIFNATYPRLSRAAGISAAAVDAEYDRAFRTSAGLVVPIGLTASLMPTDMLRLWTGDAAIATAAGPTTTALVLGAMAIALSLTPTALQLARRDTRALSRIGAVFVLLMAITVATLGAWFGALGAAAAWSALAWGYLLAAMFVKHRLGGVIRSTRALSLHLAATCVAGSLIVASVMLVLPDATTRVGSALRLGVAGTAALVGVFLMHNASAQKLALHARVPTT